MARIQIWGGGPYHPTAAQSVWLKKAFQGMGHEADYREDRGAFEAANLEKTDLLFLMGMEESAVMPVAELQYWETPANRVVPYRPLAQEHWDALMAYLAKGKPLFIHHSGILSFDERKELNDIYDGRWIRGQTFHPPYHNFRVRVCGDHPVLAGVNDFDIDDEMYCKVLGPKRAQVLLKSTWEGQEQPLAWATRYGNSKILFNSLGHDMKTYQCPEFQKLVTNGVAWLLS